MGWQELKQVIHDVDGKISSKRIISVGSFILLAAIVISDLFFNMTVSEFILDSLEMVIIGVVGFTGLEQLPKFANRNKSNPPNPDNLV